MFPSKGENKKCLKPPRTCESKCTVVFFWLGQSAPILFKFKGLLLPMCFFQAAITPDSSRPWGSILCCFHCVSSQRRGQDAHQLRLSLLFFGSLKWILGSIVSSCANSTWDVKVQLLWLLSFDVWPWRCQWIKSMSTNSIDPAMQPPSLVKMLSLASFGLSP